MKKQILYRVVDPSIRQRLLHSKDNLSSKQHMKPEL